MGRKGNNTSVELREFIINLSRQGLSYRQIGEETGTPLSTIQSIIRRYKTEQRIHDKPKTGRPRLLSVELEQLVLRTVEKNPQISAPKIAASIGNQSGVNVHPETVRRVLRRNNYKGRVATNKPYPTVTSSLLQSTMTTTAGEVPSNRDEDGDKSIQAEDKTLSEQDENLSLNIKKEALSPNENAADPEETENDSNNETSLEPMEKVICVKKELLYEERSEDPLIEDSHEKIFIKEEPINETRLCKCSQQCTKLTPNIREKIFESYCKLSENDKSAFLVQCMELKQPLRRTVKEGTSRRQFTFSYSVQLGETSQRIKICLKTLCDLTGCTPRRIQVLQNKVKLGISDFSDLRGKHHNRPNRIADEVRDLVREHISRCLIQLMDGSLESRKLFITTHLNVKEMYDSFKTEYPDLKVSESVFRRTYNDFRL